MPSIKMTYILLILSIVYVFLFYFTIEPPENTQAFGYAIGRALFIWLVAGLIVSIKWIYCKLFKKQGDYLAQFNWTATVMTVLSIILWLRDL